MTTDKAYTLGFNSDPDPRVVCDLPRWDLVQAWYKGRKAAGKK